MGGKTGTTASNVSIPPEILARYNSVNARAEQVAQTPFQNYSTDPNAFVAPLTGTQQAGIANTNSAAGLAQPYFGAATQAYGQGMGAALPFTMAGGQAVNPSNMDSGAINKYMSPYLNTVLGTTMAAQGEQNAQQRSAMQGNAISAGAFGGDRAGIGQANLAYQQNLSNNQTIANILNQGYGQALSTAQQQQGVGLSAEQANRAASQGTGQALFNQFTGYGQGLAALGSGAQQAGLMGAGAQLQAGQFEQQTGQAGLSALYNQYLQERSYPFQTTQFLGNLAMGTGALSGSNTTTTQPTPFFSDARLKENMEPIGETYDGQKIVKFNYKGQKQKQIGLVAQDVERHHPDAVGQSHGFKTVDYDAATEESARRAPRYQGGLAPVVSLDDYRAERAGGGLVSDIDLERLAAQRAEWYGKVPYAVAAGPYGGSPNATPRGAPPGIVPPGNLPVPKLVTASPPPGPPKSGMSQFGEAVDAGGKLEKLYDLGNRVFGSAERPTAKTTANKPPAAAPAAAPATARETAPPAAATTAAPPAAATTPGARPGGNSTVDYLNPDTYQPTFAAAGGAIGGGLVPRHGYQTAGEVEGPQSPQDIYEPKNGPGLNIPQMNSTPKLPAPPAAPASAAASSGGGDAALKLISTAATIAAMFMSDKRLKENIQPVGKTFDGQNIYKYNFKGDPKTQIGLIAQEVQRRHPDAVGKFNGFKTVDYDSATKDAADRGHFYGGGLVPRQGYQTAGEVVETGNFDTGEEFTPDLVPPRQRENDHFARSLNRTLGFEGGLLERDTNGTPTNFGINQGANPDVNVRNLSPDRVRELYRQRYWNAINGDELARQNPDLAHVAFDTSVIAGPGKAKELLSQAEGDPRKLLALRQQFHDQLVQSNPEKYGQWANNWRNRVNALGQDIDAAPPGGGVVPASNTVGSSTPPPAVNSSQTSPENTRGLGAAQANTSTTVDAPRNTVAASTEVPAGLTLPESGSQPKDDRTWFQRNADWLLPLASGLGTMASSKSRYGLAAGLEGLAGAASGYIKGQELEQNQQTVDTAQAAASVTALRYLSGQYTQFVKPDGTVVFRSNTGGPDLTQDQMQSLYKNAWSAMMQRPGRTAPASPFMSVAARPGAEASTATPPARPPTASAAPASAAPTPAQSQPPGQRPTATINRDALGLPMLTDAILQDPALLTEAGRIAAEVAANNTGRNPAVAEAAMQRRAAIDEAQNRLATVNVAPNTEFFNNGAAASAARQQARSQLQQIQSVLEYYQPGAFAAQKAEIARALNSVNLNVPATATINPDAFQQFLKNTYASVFTQLSSMPGQTTNKDLEGLIAQNPNPGLEPAANRKVLSSLLGYINHKDAEFNAAVQERDRPGVGVAGFNRAGFQTNWQRNPENNPNKYVDESHRDTPVRGATPANGEDLIAGHQYILEPGQYNNPGSVPVKVKYNGISPDTGQRMWERVR